jgi:hypothetical protein
MLSFVRYRSLFFLHGNRSRACSLVAVLASASLAGCSGGSETESATTSDPATTQSVMPDTAQMNDPSQMSDPSMTSDPSMMSGGSTEMDPAAMAAAYGTGDSSGAGYPSSDPTTAGYPSSDPAAAGYPSSDPATAGYPSSGPGYPGSDPATAAGYPGSTDPALAGTSSTELDPTAMAAAYAAGAPGDPATTTPGSAGYPSGPGAAGYPGEPGSSTDPAIGATPGGEGYPGGPNGEGSPGGGTPQAPPKDAPEYPAFMLVSGLIKGEAKGLDEFVSARGIGILKKISTGQIGEADLKEMKEKLANPTLVGAPRNTRGGRQLVLRSGDNMITILVKKEGGGYKVAEFKIAAARR